MKFFITTSITIFLLFIATNIFAQNFIRSSSIEVQQNEAALKYAWSGGLNNPQFSNADLNNDGVDDLVIFDRKADKFLTFISGATENEIDWAYEPAYEYNFPEAENWALLVDYNCDGIKDLFSSKKNFNHCSVYKGMYIDNKLNFELAKDTLFTLNTDGEIKPLYIPIYDVPGIQDIDNDNDIDILTFNIAGGYLEYHKNLSAENGFECNNLTFEMADTCFGKFYESGLTPEVRLSNNTDTCASRVGKRSPGERHPGSTIMAVDFDADDDKELFLGDISYNNINMLTNAGDLSHAYMNVQDSLFPNYDKSAFFNYFPGTYYVDVNNDNIRDFIAAPNGLNNAVNIKCSWLYLNEGEDNKPILSFKEDDFLVNEMIDVGERARPVLVDYDADGLLDLVVGNAGYYELDGFVSQLKSTLTLFKNVGTATAPIFNLVSVDYANLSKDFGFDFMHPTFGDLDNDGDADMLLGDGEGFVHYFKNEAGMQSAADFKLSAGRFGGIDVGQRAAPYLFDFDEDNLLDLVVGTRNGNLNYYKNIGTKEVPSFELVNDFWGEIDVQQDGEITGYATPVLKRLGEDQELTLIIGSESGKIFAYNNIIENLDSGAFNLITDNFLNERIGRFSAVAIDDLNNDDKPDVMVGTERGGLALFTEDTKPGIAENHQDIKTFNIYPNPANQFLTIEDQSISNAQFQITNSIGQIVYETIFKRKVQIDLKPFINGIYFVKMQDKDVIKIAKLLIQQ